MAYDDYGREYSSSIRRRALSARASAAALGRTRRICLALPETTERLSHGSPTFFIRDKHTFVMFMDDHHSDGRLALWIAAPEGAQEVLISADAQTFFRPPYVGHRGWLGVRLDRKLQWDAVAALIDDAYAVVAASKTARKPVKR